jgi:glucan phosphoethanolaminetransferase (alkaline phosphatase superfamily)
MRKVIKHTQKRKEKKKDKVHSRIFIGLLILFITFRVLFDINDIGHDVRYEKYIFGLPTLTGVVALGIYRLNFLKIKIASLKNVWGKTLAILFFLLQGIIISYLSFGQAAHITWSLANRIEAANKQPKTMAFTVERFWTRKSPQIDFKFHNNFETIRVSYKSTSRFENQNPKNYILSLKVRKGIWNYYIVDSWAIKRKGNHL